jgi:hypothetical protein
VVIRESTAIVGPLIVPEYIQGSGCPRCVDLHRAERDPSWPLLCRQLRQSGAAGPAPVTLVWATAALAVSQILELLDRRSRSISPVADTALASLGATLELSPEAWTWRRRWWGQHPACICATHPTTV